MPKCCNPPCGLQFPLKMPDGREEDLVLVNVGMHGYLLDLFHLFTYGPTITRNDDVAVIVHFYDRIGIVFCAGAVDHGFQGIVMYVLNVGVVPGMIMALKNCQHIIALF